MSRSPRQSTAWFHVALAALALLAVAPRPSAAQLERGSVSGTVVDQQGGVVPGVTVTATNLQTRQTRTVVTDATGFYTFPHLRSRPVRRQRRAPGLQEGHPRQRAARRGRHHHARLHARDRRAHRGGDRHRRRLAAADRRRAPQDRRGEGHRAAVVLGPQPDRRRRPEGRRRRRQLQQPRLLRPRQRRLQHQRQPQRREQHHRRRRHGHPHPVDRRDHRHPERRRRSRKSRS